MTSAPPPRTWMRIAVPIVALLAYLVAEGTPGSASNSTTIRGDGWSITRSGLASDAPRLGGSGVPGLGGSGVLLLPGDAFRLAEEETAEHRITQLRVVLERMGTTGFADLRFRVQPSVAHELKIAPAESLGVTLLRVPRDAPRTRLGGASGKELLPQPLTPFAFVLDLESDRIAATVDEVEAFVVPDDHERTGAIELSARAEPLRVHAVSVSGRRGDQPYRFDVDFRAANEPSPWGSLLRATALAVAAFLLLSSWLFALCSGRVPLRIVVSYAAFPGTIPLAISTLASLVPGVSTGLLSNAGAWLLGALLARIALGRCPDLRLETMPRFGWLVRVGAVLSALVVIAWSGARRELALLEPARTQVRAAAQEPPPEAYLSNSPTTLDAGNALLLEGPFRDFDLRVALTLAPDSVVEVRLHGQRADGVVFLLSASEKTATRFVRSTAMEFETISRPADLAPHSRAIELEIDVRSDSYVARVDGREIASVRERLFAAGSTGLFAARGRAVLHRMQITPLESGPRDDGRTHDALVGATRPIVVLLALAALAALLLKRDLLGSTLSAGVAALPFALVLGELGRDVASGVEPIALPLFFVVALAFDHLQRAKETSPLRLNVSLIAAVCVAFLAHSELERKEWPPTVSDLNALTCLDVDSSSRRTPELLHFEHPLLRRWNFYLADHRFRDRVFATARTPGRERVIALGTSSTYGYGATEDWPTLLERELRSPTHGSRNVEVINAGTPGATSWRLLYYLENVLVRFEPDVLVVSFYYNDSVALTQFDERTELERITREGLGTIRELLVSRMLGGGGKRFLTLDLDYRAREFDALASWDVPGLSAPPLRFEAIMREYAESCRTRGIRLVLLQEPISADRRRIWKDEFRAVFTRIGNEYGAPVVDSTAAQLAGGGEKLFMDEVHPNADGHRITARQLAPVVASELDAARK